jgi:hypothetical protein
VGLDDHYKRGDVQRELDEARLAKERLRAHYAELRASWTGAVGHLNLQLQDDLRRFAAAMKRSRVKSAGPPGAQSIHVRRPIPLSLPFSLKTVWYWSLRDFADQAGAPRFNISAEVVVTDRGRLAVVHSGRRMAPEMPKGAFEPPDTLLRERVVRTDTVDRHIAATQYLPPSTEDVSRILAEILHTHNVLL